MENITKRFEVLYDSKTAKEITPKYLDLISKYKNIINKQPVSKKWDEKDVILITYADMISKKGEKPLTSLHKWLKNYLKGTVSIVHFLPFFPSTSDGGFAVSDYSKIDENFGDWNDVDNIRQDFDLMFDFVVNHCSASHNWFKEYLKGTKPYDQYFIEADPNDERLKQVTRARSHPLLTPFETANGQKFLWTTFSTDQLDVNFKNPDVLFEYLDILLFYVSKGMRIVRLDALHCCFKELGTTCMNLKQTHEVCKIIRDTVHAVASDVIILTETNLPHKENISYFGNGDEAEMVYQFALPPLTLYALTFGDASLLTNWAKDITDIPDNCTYLNFTASHDGIGVRALEALADKNKFNELIEIMETKGAKINTRQQADGSHTPYEICTTYFDAFAENKGEVTDKQIKQFLCSQAISLCLPGIPAIYFHSFASCHNNYNGFEQTKHNRDLNRYKWQYDELCEHINKDYGQEVFNKLKTMINARTKVPAFNPNAQMEICDVSDSLFAVKRISSDKEIILAVHNVSDKEVSFDLNNFAAKKALNPLTNTESDCKQASLTLKPYDVYWLYL